MPLSPRLIRRRIKSVGNTRKITKAMELVAASKMRRAITAALASRRYATVGWQVIGALAERAGAQGHPLWTERVPRRGLLILVTSHRGLAGGFNANVIKQALSFARGQSGIELATVAVGRKGEEALRRAGLPPLAVFSIAGDTPRLSDATPLAALARQEFVAGRADRVWIAYTDYVSAIRQEPRLLQLLPVISTSDVTGHSRRASSPAERVAPPPAKKFFGEMLFEPSAELILSTLLPRMIDTQVYQTLLESAAAEHSARMMAMQNATKAAGEMIDDLAFVYNQARQSAITREISEIAAGKATLEA